MFNEKSNVWIQIYKGITIAQFIVSVLSGMIIGALEASRLWYMNTSLLFFLRERGGIINFFVWIILGFVIGFVPLVVNMLIIQFLNNVQLIREKVEKKE